MRLSLSVLSLLLLAGLFGESRASANCGAVRDADDRALCRAKKSGNAGECGAIRDSDKRAYCRAVVRKNSGECGAIRDADLRHRCRSEAG